MNNFINKMSDRLNETREDIIVKLDYKIKILGSA